MLKRRLCEATIVWKLECEGPLLIADGRYKKVKETKCPDKFFISRTKPDIFNQIVRNSGDSPPNNLDFYVPGTSIRGPFRAQAEMVIRSLLPENAMPPFSACIPFGNENDNPTGCSNRLKNHKTNDAKSKYALACPACKLFGFAGLSGRIVFADADIAQGYRSVYRDMIGIDRLTGGVYSGIEGGGAKMRLHVLENTTFSTKISVVNFELWQIGLLAYIFRDFADQRISIGFGKTKGFGQVKGAVEKIILSYPKDVSAIEHTGSLMTDPEEKKYYGIEETALPVFGNDILIRVPDEFSLYTQYEVADINDFWKKTAPCFKPYIDALNARAMEVQ